ncbi:MAG: hypothetical protein AAB575_04420, partial [Patescibacteria group bacterium]
MPQETSSIIVLSKATVIEFKMPGSVYKVFLDWLRNACVRGDDWLYLLPVAKSCEPSTVIAKIVVPTSKHEFFCLKLGYFCNAQGYNFD